MSPEQLDKARVKEAFRLHPHNSVQGLAECVARLAREGWTPPDPISPRLRAAREWLKTATPISHGVIDSGSVDYGPTCLAFLAGFAAAVEKAGPLVEYLSNDASSLNGGRADANLQTYRQEIGDE